MTPAGTRPADSSRTPRSTGGAAAPADETPRYESGRYTAPHSKALDESPSWVPILMLSLFAVGGLLIMARYLWWDSNIPMVVGMVALLAGLFTATKWR